MLKVENSHLDTREVIHQFLPKQSHTMPDTTHNSVKKPHKKAARAVQARTSELRRRPMCIPVTEETLVSQLYESEGATKKKAVAGKIGPVAETPAKKKPVAGDKLDPVGEKIATVVGKKFAPRSDHGELSLTLVDSKYIAAIGQQYTTLNPYSPDSPEMYTTSEAAAWLRYRSAQTVAKIFQGVQGVIDIPEGPGGNKRGPKHHILIPRHILKRFCEDHSGRKTKLQQAQEEMRVRNLI